MSFYNTGNPVPSIDPRDLDDNAKHIDEIANSTEFTYVDRLGVTRYTMAGMNSIASAAATLPADLADTSNPAKGAALVGRGVISVDSIASLLLCPRRTDLRYSVKGYIAGTDFGGGQGFYWNDTSVEVENLVTVFAVPGVPVGRFYRGGPTGSILVDDAGAQPGVLTSQRVAIERADAVALATGSSLCFRGGVTYYADELFIKSTVVLGNGTRILKTATTMQGHLNWGNKPDGIVDGLISGFTLDANGKDNVVNLRIYGDHTRSRVRDMRLIDSDFYALGVGSLTTPGDKLDVINGLELQGIYIQSERGNVAESTAYSFGLEIFPGVICKDLKIRNVHTVGKIINKIHSFIGVDIDNVNFIATSVFDPLSSGYCEINNCKDVKIGQNCVFDGLDTDTYYTLLIGGTRVVGGQSVTGAKIAGTVKGRLAIEKVEDLTGTSGLSVSRQIVMYNTSNSIIFNACRALGLLTPVGSTGAIASIQVNGGSYLGPIRFDVPGIPIAKLSVTGGTYDISTDQFRLNTVAYASLKCPVIRANGSPLTYMISAKSGTLIMDGVTLDGSGTWNRPVLAVDATGIIYMYNCVLERFTSSTVLASGSAALAANIRSIVNGV